MSLRNRLAIVAGFALVSAAAARTSAQNEAPFTIRYPPDGATVRENVHIRIPLASIPENGYIVLQVDRQFLAAVAPSQEQRDHAKPGALFEYVWDTKAPMKVGRTRSEKLPTDGEHQIDANLYAPGENNAVTLKQNSSVKVTLANQIAENDPVTLRYRFHDGNTYTYKRDGSAQVQTRNQANPTGKSEDEFVGQRSELLVSVEDTYPDSGRSMVRNKLTELVVRSGDKETVYPAEQLTKSLYQEVDPLGHVAYQNKTVSFDEFAKLGIPVSTTLELPLLPDSPKRVNDTWDTSGVSLDIPGTSPSKQPKATVTNTLVAFEWQGGYPTAKIHQHFQGKPTTGKNNSLTFGATEIQDPTVTFDRDIWVAYRAGTLVKMVRTVEVRGKIQQAVDLNGMSPGSSSSGYPGGSYPGYGSGSSYPGYGSGSSYPGYGSGSSSGYYGRSGSGSSYPGYGSSGSYGRPGYGSGSSGSYYGRPGYGSGGSGGYPSGYPGDSSGMQAPQETVMMGLKSTTTTELTKTGK